jgi:hypothetical protein
MSKPQFLPVTGPVPDDLADLANRAWRVGAFARRIAREGFGLSYEFAHAMLVLDCARTVFARREMLDQGRLALLPEASQAAADQLYLDATTRVMDGLAKVMRGYAKSDDPKHKAMYEAWEAVGDSPGWANIRSEGTSQSFKADWGWMRMSITGHEKASCGWAKDLEVPVALPEGARLVIEISGSPDARYFVDLMDPAGKGIFQTLWQDTPQARTTVEYPLTAGTEVGQVVLYLMTMSDSAHDDWWRVQIVDAAGKPLARFVGE